MSDEVGMNAEKMCVAKFIMTNKTPPDDGVYTERFLGSHIEITVHHGIITSRTL